MSQLNNTVVLAPRCRTKLNNLGQLNNQTGTLLFVVPARPVGGISAVFMAVGTLTGLTTALQVDLVSRTGANLTAYPGTFTFAAANPVAVIAAAAASPLVGGALYALNVTALTGTADIYALVE